MRFFIDTGLEDEMTTEAVAIDFKMRSVSLADPENEESFWKCVKASAPGMRIKIDLKQTDDELGAMRTVYGQVFVTCQ